MPPIPGRPLRPMPGRVLFLLDSQWFKDPDRALKVLERYKAHEGGYWSGRARFCQDMLFMGCLTGRRLEAALEPVFGDRYWTGFVFEESTDEVAPRPGRVMPPKEAHVVGVLRYHRPGLVVACGRVAGEALELLGPTAIVRELGSPVVETCHPAARTDAADRLKTMALVVAHWRRDNPYVEPGVVPRKSVAKGGD